MSKEEFENFRFGVGNEFLYKEQVYKLISVDFEEGLIGLEQEESISPIFWVRYENCKVYY